MPATTTLPPAHSRATRVLHALLALAVVTQLTTSLILQPPERGHEANLWFTLHEYAGLAGLAVVLAFWAAMTLRRRGTPAGLLFPWVSGTRMRALWSDLGDHARTLRRLRLPEPALNAPLPSAVQGLGLLLITAMAATGTAFYFLPAGAGTAHLALEVHETLANLVWAYLIGHAGMAVLHEAMGQPVLASVWIRREGVAE